MTEYIIPSKDIYLWCETFGSTEKTPILLIQGSGAQGILWPISFCEALAQRGHFVIRYDHRDTGLSSSVDFNKNPYELKDLAEDAKNILDYFDLKKTHIVGSSMGGYIAQLLGIHYPNRLLTLTLMMSSLVSLSLDHAFVEARENPFSLPLPTKEFIKSLLEIGPVPQTQEGRVNYMLSIWSAYNGKALPYDYAYWYSLAKTWITRGKNISSSYNHRLAVCASPLSREAELRNLHVPTLIVQGSVDPFFPVEHAYALQEVIPSSSLVIVEKMGHLFHDPFRGVVLQALLSHMQKHDA